MMKEMNAWINGKGEINPKLYVRMVGEHERGVFAKEKIEKDEVLARVRTEQLIFVKDCVSKVDDKIEKLQGRLQ